MSEELNSKLLEMLSRIDVKAPELMKDYLEYKSFINEVGLYIGIALIVMGIASIVVGIYKDWIGEVITVMGILPLLMGCLVSIDSGIDLYKINNYPDVYVIDSLRGK